MDYKKLTNELIEKILILTEDLTSGKSGNVDRLRHATFELLKLRTNVLILKSLIKESENETTKKAQQRNVRRKKKAY